MYNKPGRILKGGISDTGRPLPDREVTLVDVVLGMRRRAVQIGTAFFGWPIAQAYPTWHQFQQQIAEERAAAEKEGREPHPAAQPPWLSKVEKQEADGMDTAWRGTRHSLPVKNSKKLKPPGGG